MASTFSDLANNLDKQLEDVKVKRAKAEQLEAELHAAAEDYHKSLESARSLKSELNTLLAESLGAEGKPKIG